jgi:hypothetical protein
VRCRLRLNTLKDSGTDRTPPQPLRVRALTARPQRHIDATKPGEIKDGANGLLFIGTLSDRIGSAWQYPAIDVASGYTWAELHRSERDPRSRRCQTLHHRLAHELALAG